MGLDFAAIPLIMSESDLKFRPANKRQLIPPLGLHPELPSECDLSAGLQLLRKNSVLIMGSLRREPTIPEMETDRASAKLAESIRTYFPLVLGIEHAFPPPFAAAQNSETLYRQIITPMLTEHALKNNQTEILVPNRSYPILFWQRDILEQQGLQLVESCKPSGANDLYDYFIEGAVLPSSVAAVYIDFPATYGGTSLLLSREDKDPRTLIRQFAEKNPRSLIVVDQGNQGFEKQPLDFERFDISPLCRDLSNVIVTYTASKLTGNIRLGGGWAFSGVQNDIFNTDGLTPVNMADAVGLLGKTDFARTVRKRTVEFRAQIADKIGELFGSDALPFGEGVNPNLIITATSLGYKDANQMVGDFVERFGLGLKACTFYGDNDLRKELGSRVYMHIPITPRVKDSIINAFEERKREL
jgi:hypothetical protein